MANDEHVALLKQGVEAWNAWRHEDPFIRPDLSGADLRGARLIEAMLSNANLFRADLTGANLLRAPLFEANLERANLAEARLTEASLREANLTEANLREANLFRANLREANFTEANLTDANLRQANLTEANLTEANLAEADLTEANLSGANLTEANLSGAILIAANLYEANLTEANLREANLHAAALVGTDLTGVDLTGCRIYGVSAWGLKLEGTKQQNLVITDGKEPEITVDNIEVAQFIYLLLHNEKIHDVIDTITSKAVLILGRFTDERKAVLNALREELRKRNYLPILFDFDKSTSQTTDETITLLARMSRSLLPIFLMLRACCRSCEQLCPTFPRCRCNQLSSRCRRSPACSTSTGNRSFLKVHPYASQEQLIADLGEKVIRPAELKVLDLRGST
jgi:uncharacterized protein YjbI with pentapeptide repeats